MVSQSRTETNLEEPECQCESGSFLAGEYFPRSYPSGVLRYTIDTSVCLLPSHVVSRVNVLDLSDLGQLGAYWIWPPEHNANRDSQPSYVWVKVQTGAYVYKIEIRRTRESWIGQIEDALHLRAEFQPLDRSLVKSHNKCLYVYSTPLLLFFFNKIIF